MPESITGRNIATLFYVAELLVLLMSKWIVGVNMSLRKTRVLPVNPAKIGRIVSPQASGCFTEGRWHIELAPTRDAQYLVEAAEHLKSSDTPVAFPTETVYGLGADATRHEAVQNIFKVKNRPADNPLIVHVCSLPQLRGLLQPNHILEGTADPIPSIYHSTIKKFWPGPLSILLPLPTPSPFAPQVTNSLKTFVARMPDSELALALINLAGKPLATPSANTSTRPSPTTAAHVLHDLDGRIDIIIDGGPCDRGVESTVVDGLSNPPMVLRPGSISIDQIRECAGWEGVEIGYKDSSELRGTPKAPGMKYKHYSPKASVVLVLGALEDAVNDPLCLAKGDRIGIIRTEKWVAEGFGRLIGTITQRFLATALNWYRVSTPQEGIFGRYDILTVWEASLGADSADIARGLYSALRDLDEVCVDTILVEGLSDKGDAAAAVMNRLSKAAEHVLGPYPKISNGTHDTTLDQ